MRAILSGSLGRFRLLGNRLMGGRRELFLPGVDLDEVLDPIQSMVEYFIQLAALFFVLAISGGRV